MRQDIAFSGALGLAVGLLLFLGAMLIKADAPPLERGSIGAWALFGILAVVALTEMPLMLFVLRQVARSPSPSRGALLGINASYVGFACVYAGILLVLTGETVGALALAVLSPARFLTGAWIE